jgi:hypothetical protein
MRGEMKNVLQKRFAELSAQAELVGASKAYRAVSREYDLDPMAILNWKVKAKGLIDRVCGAESEHATEFRNAAEGSYYTSDETRLARMVAVFEAAREDFEGGYLVSIRSLVQSQVFDSELDQAMELLASGYAVAAAVIAGTVLETSIRDLCDRNTIPHAKVEKMNADLVKAEIYNTITQKRVTHLMAIRNSAAHGNKDEFNAADVHGMIEEIEKFLALYLL